MKYLLHVATAIAEGKRDEKIQKMIRDLQSEIEEEIITLSSNDINEILNIVFPEEILTDSNFYNLLGDVQYYTGYKPFSQRFIASLWVAAYNRLSPDEKLVLLKSLLDERQRGFWKAINSLLEFCSQVEIEPQFAAVWFFELVDRVKGDLAGGTVFGAVRKYAFHFPEFGLVVFEKYISEDIDELRLNLAANLLGALRSSASKGNIEKEPVKKWDDQLLNDPKTAFRLCYHKSWVASFDLGTVSIPQLDIELTKMLNGVPEEIDDNLLLRPISRWDIEEITDRFFIG
jgi:hypothetical protein